MELKEIKYRGELINFSIPAYWKEEYEDKGGGVFYEDIEDSATFKLNVLTIEIPENEKSAKKGFAESIEADLELIDDLSNGNLLARKIVRTKENGISITIHFWHLLNQVDEIHVRIAQFSYTILSKIENTQKVKSELIVLKMKLSIQIFIKRWDFNYFVEVKTLQFW